jgi:serine/threonine-protein kinase
MSGPSLQRLGDYLLIERVGEGGMAEVFRAQYSGEEHSVGPMSVVVVKRIKPELFNKPEFPIFREMFLNEAKLVRSLQHPNLARVYALLEAVDPVLQKKIPFIVQEYVRGQPLWELLRIATRGFTGLGVSVPVALFISREMARGLGHAHAHKDSLTGKLQPIIHRDISPENVMVSDEGSIKVIDFGVAKALGGFGPQTRTGIIKGKLAYMAPEQVAQKVVPATDVFGAGIVLHEMLTGRRLFGGHNEFVVISRVLKAEIPRPSQLTSGIPKEVDDVVMTALSRDLKTRYVDGNAFADALTRVMAKLPETRGTTSTTIKQWTKQIIAEGHKISSNWDEEESGVHVDVEDAMRRVEQSGDDLVELTADDLMKTDVDGTLDPGVRAAVTMGLKTLRPDMIPGRASRNSLPGIGEGSAPGLAPVSAAAAPATNDSAPVPRVTPPRITPPRITPPRITPPRVTPPRITPPAVQPPPAGQPTPAPMPIVRPLASDTSQPGAEAPRRPTPQPPGLTPAGLLPPGAAPDAAQAAAPMLAELSAHHGQPRSPQAPEFTPAPAVRPVSARVPTVPAAPPPPILVTGAQHAFIDKQVERWAKAIVALIVLALVLIVLLLLRD